MSRSLTGPSWRTHPAYPALLHLRARVLPATLAGLCASAAAATLLAHWLVSQADGDLTARAPVAVLAPTLLAAIIGIGLHSHTPETDDTSARSLPLLRAVQILTTTLLAVLLLLPVAPDHSTPFGAEAMARNLLGATGVTALTATLAGARLSWLPMLAVSGAGLLSATSPDYVDALWEWLLQPGPQTQASVTAVASFAVGTLVHAWWGPRRSDDHP